MKKTNNKSFQKNRPSFLIMNNSHWAALLLSCIVTSLTIISCNNPSRVNNEGDIGQTISSEKSIDIPVSINLLHTDDEDMRQLVDAEYEITRETEDVIYIDVNSNYYKQYMSGKRFTTPLLAYYEYSENVEYLTLDLDIVNNKSKSLSINEMNIEVDESRPDTIPIVYICTTEEVSNCLYFVNESWFNWNGFTFSYTILKKGESFNGKYKRTRHIPFFDDYAIIDLLPDMKEMGYDFDELLECVSRYNGENIIWEDVESRNHNDARGQNLCFSINPNNEDFSFFQNLFKPFELKEDSFGEYVGSATLYGSIKFDNTDFKVDFIANISLSTEDGFGAASYENDGFDVKLRSYGNNYTLRYPYTTVIEPYGTERIKLTVVADKSSSHKFHINIKNDNDLVIQSKDIYFHHYYPKN